MFKFDLKSLVAGIIIGSFGLVSVFAGSNIYSARESDVRIAFGKPWKTNTTGMTLINTVYMDPIMSITNELTGEAKLYIPMRETLERMGYEVEWIGDIPGAVKSQVSFWAAETKDIGEAGYDLTHFYAYGRHKPEVSVAGMRVEPIFVEPEDILKGNGSNLYGYDSFQQFVTANMDLPLISIEDEISVKFPMAPGVFNIRLIPLDDSGRVTMYTSHPFVNYIQKDPEEYKFNLERSDINLELTPWLYSEKGEDNGGGKDETLAAIHISYACMESSKFVTDNDSIHAVVLVRVKK